MPIANNSLAVLTGTQIAEWDVVFSVHLPPYSGAS